MVSITETDVITLLLGSLALLCLQCCLFTAWAVVPISRDHGWPSLRVQYLLSFTLKSLGLGILFSYAFAWRVLMPAAEVGVSALVGLVWLRNVGYALAIVGVILTLRALTRDRCGEAGWLAMVLLNVAIIATWGFA